MVRRIVYSDRVDIESIRTAVAAHILREAISLAQAEFTSDPAFCKHTGC